MDHVRVHFNSAQPAQLNALAYAQGSDIHLALRQERHLPHEAWHVVQQAQGRVRPTLQMKEGVQVNEDAGLEAEADVMGTKALEGGHRAELIDGPITMPIATTPQIEVGTANIPDVKAGNNDGAPLASSKGSAQWGGFRVQRQVQTRGDGSERVGQLRAWQGGEDARRAGGIRQDLTPGFVQAGVTQRFNGGNGVVQMSGYSLTKTSSPLNIKERECATGEIIQFTKFTSCVGVIGKISDNELVGIHLSLIDANNNWFDEKACEKVKELLNNSSEILIIGEIDFWDDKLLRKLTDQIYNEGSGVFQAKVGTDGKIKFSRMP